MSSYFNTLFLKDGTYKQASASSYTMNQLFQQGLKAYEQCSNCPGTVALRQAKNTNIAKNNNTNNK
jgi:hypothetical protein